MIDVYLTIMFIIQSLSESIDPTKTPLLDSPIAAEVVVNTGTGVASHALSAKGFKGIQAHYLQEYHLTTIHLTFRPPNRPEVKHGISWANASCKTQEARATKVEEYEASILKELFGENVTNVKNQPEHLTPSFPGGYPDLIVNPNMRGSKTIYGLPLTPKEAGTQRGRSGRSYKWTTKVEKNRSTSTTSTTSTTTTTTTSTEEWAYNEYEDEENSDELTTTKEPIPKPTTKPIQTTEGYMEPTIDEEFETKRFKVHGQELVFQGINSKYFEQTMREATVLLMFAMKDEVYQAMKSIQSMPKESAELEVWSTNNQRLENLRSHVWSPNAEKDIIYHVIEGIKDSEHTVIDSKNLLEVSSKPIFFGSRFTRFQAIIETYEAIPDYYWPTVDESESNPIPLPIQTFTYTQKGHTGTVGGTKLCTRPEPRVRHAYCRTVSHGINFGHEDQVDLQILLSKHPNTVILSQASVVWESTKKPVITVQTAIDQADIHHRSRRQAAFVAGLVGAATAIGAEMWTNHHTSDGENYKTLTKHLDDLSKNVDQAIMDENTKSINIEKHMIQVDHQEWLLYCTDGIMLRNELRNYYTQKIAAIVQSAQLLGSQLKRNPMDTSLREDIQKICENHNPKDPKICSQNIIKAEMVQLKHHGPTIIAEIEIKTPVTEIEYRDCRMMEEVSLPRLTFLEEKKLTIVEELNIPKRVRIQCQDASYFFDSKGVHMLDSSNILLELVESTTSLECDTEFMNCPKNQFTSKSSCHRKLYSTINGKQYLAISSTTPISDSDFSTLHSLGVHGKTRRKDEKAKLFIKVYPQKPKSNILISCGNNQEKEYQLHKSSKPDEVTILHLEQDIGMEATKTLVDELDDEMKNIKKEQKDEVQNIVYWRTQ